MPDVAYHHAFGQDVRAALSPETRGMLSDAPFLFALYGPDIWFLYQPWKRRQGRGRRMHTTRCGDFLTALALRARDGESREEIFSYLAGFLCHYALDSTLHPYIVWQTTETWPFPEAHRDMEHAMDAALLKREGFWGERHPVTDHHMTRIQLPESLDADLDAVYGEVYGWRNVRSALNRSYLRYRKLYRFMEKPRSLFAFLATVIPTHTVRSISYSRSSFLDLDAENTEHQAWKWPCAPEQTSAESAEELYARALEDAVRMIEDCRAFAADGAFDEAELRRRLGNRSYLSGLDADDPRNQRVRSLRPPE